MAKKTFKGLYVEPKINECIEALIALLDISYPTAYDALSQACEADKPVPIKTAPHWYLAKSKTGFYAIYTPKYGLNSDEALRYRTRAVKSRLIATFKPLTWAETPHKSASHLPASNELSIIAALTYTDK